jgi:hypothetical protein
VISQISEAGIRRKVLVVVASSLLLGVSSLSRGVFAAEPVKAGVEPKPASTEAYIRESIGLPALPASSERTVEVGPITLAASEAETYARFEKMKQEAQELLWLLLGDPTVISYRYDTSITKPSVTIWTSNDAASPDLPEYKKRLSELGFLVAVKSVLYSKGDYLAVRNASSHELFGFSTEADINPRVKQRIELTENNLETGQAVVGLIRTLKSKGFDVYNTYLPSDEPIIELEVSTEALKDAASMDLSKLRGTLLITEGFPSVSTQAAGPWPGVGTTWSGRLAVEGIARGGKRFSGSGSCSSGPVVRSQYGTDYILSAGHCYNGLDGLSPTPTGSQTGVPLTIFASCNTKTAVNCSPYTYGGVDSSVWNISIGSATGWFVHQAPGSGPDQGTAYTDLTIGSFDVNPGDPLICVEGASIHKYGGGSGLNAVSSCGVGADWSGDGFQEINMYPGNGVCSADSGGYVRKPSGYSYGSYNAGTMQGAITSITGIDGCWVRASSSSPRLGAKITTFYKTHVWLHNLTQGTSVWAKTW